MKRTKNDIINAICQNGEYYVSNIENGEWSYPKALKNVNKKIDENKIKSTKNGHKHAYLDIRFVDPKRHISILVELKNNFDKWKKEQIEQQLQAYVEYEKVLTGNKIIAIIANTEDERVQVWWGSDIKIDDAHKRTNQYEILSFDEYADLYLAKKNNKKEVVSATYKLNEKLREYSIPEKNRSQFVGTCLLCLKNDLKYEGLSTKAIIGGMIGILEDLLENDNNYAEKISALKEVLHNQKIEELTKEEFQYILSFINGNILPYINEKSTMGQDLLNLFFTTFNKYVGKEDKNQAFTPDHIVHFMCKVVGINRNSVVLDPCCGSGAFLVRAMNEALDDCETKEEKEKVKSSHIFGIEKYKDIYGLASTNMLIHGDGKSNVILGDCFEKGSWIEDKNINVVLMNPPYNATMRDCNPEDRKTWNNKKEDPTKGLHFVYYVASRVKSGKLAVLLPMQCAIGSKSRDIIAFKEKMLKEHTLDAVFTLPQDMFHPGASANACCMVFNLGIRHEKAPIKETFFGYFKDDGFVKRKNLGRVEKTKPNSEEGVWADIESEWLYLYNKRKCKPGLSITKAVTANDEWLAEAYIKMDYSKLSDNNFKATIRDFLAFKLESGAYIKNFSVQSKQIALRDVTTWHEFTVIDVFDKIIPTKGVTTDILETGEEIPYIAATNKLNGLSAMCKKKSNEEYISKGNCIVFIQIGAGAAGYTTYQESDFIGMSGKTCCGYSQKLNKYTGLFLKTVLDLERPRYCFGRSWTSDRLYNTKFKLPSTQDGNIDWEYMESYIKSLPYGNII